MDDHGLLKALGELSLALVVLLYQAQLYFWNGENMRAGSTNCFYTSPPNKWSQTSPLLIGAGVMEEERLEQQWWRPETVQISHQQKLLLRNRLIAVLPSAGKSPLINKVLVACPGVHLTA